MSYGPFIYSDESTLCDGAAHVSVPAGIATKDELLTVIASGLDFPGYFGNNWDALEECLRDLSWISGGRVALMHADMPLVNDVANARMYLTVLCGAVRKMPKSEDYSLSVIFPTEFREQIEWLLRVQEREDTNRAR